MSGQVDEETPLLAEDSRKKQSTPLPWFQFTIVLFLQLAEPLTSNVIYPFTPQLIRDLGITNGNESKVGYYVGLMLSLFFVAEAFTVLHWSRLSDRVGRKPIILSGLFGLSISMFCFGLSKTFWGLVLSRILCGALNGNIGVIKSMVAEMTDTTNISKAYTYMPIPWSIGSTLGPMIGGSLARPVESFPDLFGQNAFLKEYPYFLPCAIAATFSLVTWIVVFFFLKETLPAPISIGRLLNITTERTKPKKTMEPIDTSVVGILVPSGEITQRIDVQVEGPLPLRYLLTRRVLIAGGNYASLSLVDIAFRAIQPVFFSTPIELGGLGLSLPTIGKVLSISGILNGIFQVLFFARIHDRWGSKKTFNLGLACVIPGLIMYPVSNALARTQGLSAAVWTAVGIQMILGVVVCLSYGSIFIFIAASSPNRASLGGTNGLSQILVSIMRAIGPAVANSLFSVSMEKGYLGGYLVYYVLVVLTGGALYFGSMLPRELWKD